MKDANKYKSGLNLSNLKLYQGKISGANKKEIYEFQKIYGNKYKKNKKVKK